MVSETTIGPWPWLLVNSDPRPPPPRRIVVFGLGRIGRLVAALLVHSEQFEVVGALDRSSEVRGKDLADVIASLDPTNILVSHPDGFDWGAVRPDAVIYAGSDKMDVAEDHIRTAVENGAHVVGLTVGLSFAWQRFPEVAARIDALARAHGVAVFGTGVNPGFVADALPLALASVCVNVQRVAVTRVNDLSDQSAAQLDARAIGSDEGRFRDLLAHGKLKTHTGFEESAAVVSRGLGWRLTRVDRVVNPLLAKADIALPDRLIRAGHLAGLEAIGRAFSSRRLRYSLRHIHIARPSEHGFRPHDRIQIIGQPPINVTIRPEVEGAAATANIAVNALMSIAAAPHGLLVPGWAGS